MRANDAIPQSPKYSDFGPFFKALWACGEKFFVCRFGLQEADEFLNGEARQLNDGAKERTRKVAALVHGNSGCTGCVELVHQPVMTSRGADNLEVCPFERSNNSECR